VKPIALSMTTFGDFVVADSPGQLAKLREIRRQYEQPYFPGGDFWSRWREDVERLHIDGGSRRDLAPIAERAKDNRGPQYSKASRGYATFWGNKAIELAGHPKPATWKHDRLSVRVNPEWILRIGGKVRVVKLHLKERLVLSQRLANPLLFLLDEHFGPAVGGPPVGILDVQRGRLWTRRTQRRDVEAVLRMQAAALIAGWDELDQQRGVA
jgi:hypothetical protein